jgi:3-hydroxy-9,10-secoandrosta-1,3,5(10)-triene-9,17-dione monooxygenase
MSTRTPDARPLAPPEPNLTAQDLLARAVALRPLLRAKQAECEAGGNVPADVNERLVREGFYRIVQPRRFGGYECDIPSFYKVMMEIARGCSETAWVLALTSGHPLIAAYFSEEAQREAYGAAGEFRCPTVFNPPGTAVPVEGGVRLTGAWPSASGIDYATHYITLATSVDPATKQPTGAVLVMLKRGEFTVRDDWRVMGMQGTGSKTVQVDDLFVPEHRVAKTKGVGLLTNIVLPGPRIYDNPMYFGRIGAFLVGEGAAVSVGAARGALDLYEELLRSKRAPIPPFAERRTDPEFHRHYGTALSLVVTAEAALIRQGEEFMQAVHDEAAGTPFALEREQRLQLIALRALDMAWEAIELIYRTAGTSASVKEGQPIGRVFRNVAAIRTHPILQLDRLAMNAARTRLGVAP